MTYLIQNRGEGLANKQDNDGYTALHYVIVVIIPTSKLSRTLLVQNGREAGGSCLNAEHAWRHCPALCLPSIYPYLQAVTYLVEHGGGKELVNKPGNRGRSKCSIGFDSIGSNQRDHS